MWIWQFCPFWHSRRSRRAQEVGLGIQFTPTIWFGFSVYKYFGFRTISNRSVSKKLKNRRVRFRFIPNNTEHFVLRILGRQQEALKILQEQTSWGFSIKDSISNNGL
jgi:hypothetical protein